MNAEAAEQSLRDLMSLLALPAMWSGRDGLSVLQITAEAVERVVPLRLSYTISTLSPAQPPFELLRVDGRAATPGEKSAWQDAVASWPETRDIEARAFWADSPIGRLRIARFNMECGPFSSHIWVGSDSSDFPGTTQVAYLRAATSLAMTGLQTARANQERDIASRAKDEFLAMLGHELRNPLAPIVTAIAILKMKAAEPLSYEIGVIERQTTHLRRLVDDLLDVARITQGKIELRKEYLDIHAILRRALENVEPLILQRNHQVITDFDEANGQITGDVVRLTQIFSNLLINAAKYTDANGCIWVTTRSSDDKIAIKIRDSGAGMDEALVKRVFNIFEQGPSSMDRSAGGLGVGLAIVKNFVELHGGSVEAASDGLGKGAEFTVRLPLTRVREIEVPAHKSPSGSIPIAQSPPLSARILVVDDNEDVLATTERYLLARGFAVKTTSDPFLATSLAAEFMPTCAVLDIGLPGRNGYMLAQDLRRLFPGLWLVALTGYGQDKDRANAALAGFNCHAVKPVNVEELVLLLTPPASREDKRESGLL